MFEVTEKASEMIKNFLKDREELPAIRLMLAQGGWSGPQLGLALDELRNDDESFDDRGLTFVVEKEFYRQIKPVTIDYVTTTTGEGFQISSNLPEPESACGTSCACWNKQGDIKKPALIDVPAFFMEWVLERIEKGWVDVTNPFNKTQVSRVSLHPRDVKY